MGNNGSSSREEQALSVCSNGVPGSETSHGWSQSFPRELARHRSQPTAARKVLPEPPNQRLRATDNGSIIHNGGTISGRRPPTFASSRDLAKRDGPFRGRSTSASGVAEPRSRRLADHRPCCRYRADAARPDAASELKRFGSEPDLRYSPDRSSPGKPADKEDGRSSSCCRRRRVDGDSKERGETRYKARKKYKAPAPPSALELAAADDATPDARCRFDREVQPPPRRSRLFKTRAETKKAQVSWQLSGFERGRGREPSDRVGDGREPELDADPRDRDRIRRANEPRRQRSDLFDGKTTLQRSMSSPEFQAELIQVARRVRDKLDCAGNAIVGESTAIEFRGSNRRERSLERPSREGLEAGDDGRTGRWPEERPKAGGGDRSTSSKDARPEGGGDPDEGGKLLRERLVEDVQARARVERKAAAERRRRANDDRGKRGKRGDLSTATEPPIPRFAKHAKHAKDAKEARDAQDRRTCAPEARDEEPPDAGWWNGGDFAAARRTRRPDVVQEKSEPVRGRPAFPEEPRTLEARRREDDQPFVSSAHAAPRTFYFGMNEIPSSREPRLDAVHRNQETRSAFRDGEDGGSSVEATDDADDTSARNVKEDISLKLRPTLPKKQLEIPRFSPSAAWRLLSALETPGPSTSTASEEIPVMFEERIERLSRPPPPPPPPPPLLALGPRSSHDKSGDSGISGDAGAANEDSLDASTTNRMKTSATRPTWTPQQDLGEESSSDAGVDSPPPLPTPLKYPPRAHVFSLSLPREDARAYLQPPESKPREGSAFNSLKKLKRSVSGAFGLGVHDAQRKSARDLLDDNWFLSTSAPTSLQHSRVVEVTRVSSSAWRSFATRDNAGERDDDDDNDDNDDDDDDNEDGDDDDDDDEEDDRDDVNEEEEEEEEEDEEDDDDEDQEEDAEGDDEVEDDGADEEASEGKANDFPVVLKPPSFSYLAPAGRVMYLPESNEAEHRVQSFNGRKVGSVGRDDATGPGNRPNDRVASTKRRSKTSRPRRGVANGPGDSRSGLIESFENADEAKQRRRSSPCDRVPLPVTGQPSAESAESTERKPQPKSKSKSRRFTFQSTVRQIERRRLAEKLSREAEAKERQRKGELEAMRKVEEEFQRKRAKEKASIRQQLRLFKEMEENFNSLPAVEWDGSQASRAEPDGAPSSTASSPTWLSAGKLATTPGKNLESSGEYRRQRNSGSGSGSGSGSDSKHRRAERIGYRPKYYDWAPDASSHPEYKQTTVHPKIVCDIPKSSPVFVDANVHPAKPVTSNSTPRSDNYRKDFAHGTMIARSSFASSDSELSQPNTRPHSRETGIKSKSQRSRF